MTKTSEAPTTKLVSRRLQRKVLHAAVMVHLRGDEELRLIDVERPVGAVLLDLTPAKKMASSGNRSSISSHKSVSGGVVHTD
jgi:hypothetical protein